MWIGAVLWRNVIFKKGWCRLPKECWEVGEAYCIRSRSIWTTSMARLCAAIWIASIPLTCENRQQVFMWEMKWKIFEIWRALASLMWYILEPASSKYSKMSFAPHFIAVKSAVWPSWSNKSVLEQLLGNLISIQHRTYGKLTLSTFSRVAPWETNRLTISRSPDDTASCSKVLALVSPCGRW